MQRRRRGVPLQVPVVQRSQAAEPEVLRVTGPRAVPRVPTHDLLAAPARQRGGAIISCKRPRREVHRQRHTGFDHVHAVHHAVQLTQRVDDLVYITNLLEHERGAQFVCGGASRGYVQRLRVGTYKSYEKQNTTLH